MIEVAGAKTITSSPTRFEPPAGLGSAWLADILVHYSPERRPLVESDLTFATGPSVSVAQVKSGGFVAFKDAASLAAGYKIPKLPVGYPIPSINSAAESSVTVTERSVRRLLRAERRNGLLQRLSPERRATYERIRRLREEIGPLDFDVIEELRELRENG